MKILKYTALACALFTSSCGSSFLEVEPIGQMGKDQLFADVNGMRDALYGSYSLAGKFFQSQYGIYGDLRADDVERSIGGTQNYMLTDYSYSYDETDQLGSTQIVWASGYEVINNINNIIEAGKILKASNPSRLADIDAYVGQAEVMRGLMFFALANVYGQHYTYTADASHLGVPIPLKTPLPSERVARATMKETYAQIVADLESGAKLLSKADKKSRIYASQQAAEALLSRVHLYMENYDQVIQLSTKLIESGEFPLVKADNYKEMFIASDQLNWKVSSEVIWQFSLSIRYPNYMSSFYSDSDAFLAHPKASFLDLFEEGDSRKDMFEFNKIKEKYMSLKNAKSANVTDINWPVNVKVFRAAELYLNRAEAYVHKKQYELAVADLKVIIARAKAIEPSAVNVDYKSPEELLTIIKNERRKELAFEGHRIYDIMRYKSALDRGANCNTGICKLSYPNDLFILPIPKSELDANNLIKPNPTVNN